MSFTNSHGTKVTGLIAAEANNGVCIVGIAHASTIIGTCTKYKLLLHVKTPVKLLFVVASPLFCRCKSNRRKRTNHRDY